ncbi:hypothetical protein N5D61_05125 [Pseudomonas sp. GD03842]|uniref:hypothetical protein n=1 Tax=Pseudomonas sp. GD03842 TaxID=2975385 RepID=UPI00244A2405|nr:hypothetical protein [Pseudomonas sp. GD03842]MDH0745721.1 hypothetical protein [Pseudomonas sp. GD03842]
MSFGLQFINNSDSVVLDSEFARMCVIAAGSLNNNGSSDRNSTNMFGRTITTQEPPLIFVKPSNPNNGWAVSLSTFMPVGSPGAWTGFQIVSTYVQSAIFAPGEWFACQFGSVPAAQYGLRIWDGGSNLLFDSASPAANFTRSAQNWAFVKIESTDTTALRRYYSTPFNFASGEFQMVNQFGMTLVSNDNIGRSISCWWDWPTNTLWAVTMGFSNPIDFQIPALFAKRTVN